MPKLLIDVEARFAQFQDSLNKIESVSVGVADRMTDAFSGITKIVGALGAGFAVGSLVAGFSQITNAIDALNDAADATGASVENLSALENIALRNGESLDTVTDAVVKLNQALAEESGGNKAKVLDAIGLSAAELRKVDPGDALKKVADALGGFADDGNKARVIFELFGKSARELAPFLRDVAEGGELVATVTKDQADQAERFNKSLSALGAEAAKVGRTVGLELLPPMLSLLQKINELGDSGKDGTEGIGMLGEGFKRVVETVKILYANVEFVFQGIGRDLGAIAAQFAAIARLDFKGFTAIGDAVKADARVARAELDAYEKFVLSRKKAAEGPGEAGKPSVADVSVLLTTPKKADSDKMRDAAQKMIEEWSPLELRWSLKAEDFDGGANADLAKWQSAAQDRLDDLIAKYKDLADPVEKYRKEIEVITALEAQGMLTAEEAFGARGRLYEDADKAAEKLNGTLAKTKDAGDKIQLTFESALENSILHFKSFGDAATSILEDVGRAILRANITKPLIDAVSAFDFKGAFKSFLPSADGNAFGTSGLIPFASGGVVDSPTFFKFAQGAGVMGEAGLEAILPLKRGAGGKLGVSADGVGGGGVVVNIINNTPAQVTTRQTSGGGLEVMIDAIDAAIGDRVAAGVGAVSGAIQGRFGLRPSMGI